MNSSQKNKTKIVFIITLICVASIIFSSSLVFAKSYFWDGGGACVAGVPCVSPLPCGVPGACTAIKTYYRDLDVDGYGNSTSNTTACTVPVGYTVGSTDCNDNNASRNPAATDICGNGIDENCDGMDAACAACSDGATRGAPYCTQSGLCSGAIQTCNSEVWSVCSIVPVVEICGNAIDENCDGSDQACAVCTTGQTRTGSCNNLGACAESHETCLASAWNGVCTGMPGVEVCGNLIDEDCSGAADACIVCTNGATRTGSCDTDGACSGAIQTCANNAWGVCSKLPGTEICNGVDDDCDSSTDESLSAPSRSCSAGLGVCRDFRLEYQTCVGVAGWSVVYSGCTATAQPGNAQPEICDGIDNDCDGTADDGITCSCVPVAEVCDSVDNDCDGQTDEGCVTYYQDNDGDGCTPGTSQTVTANPGAGWTSGATVTGDCDDSNPSICVGSTRTRYSASTVACGVACSTVAETQTCGAASSWSGSNSITSCSPVNGSTFYVDADSDSWGTSSTTTACSAPGGYTSRAGDCDDGNAAINPGASEVLCNAVDENCDSSYGAYTYANSQSCSGSQLRQFDSCGVINVVLDACASTSCLSINTREVIGGCLAGQSTCFSYTEQCQIGNSCSGTSRIYGATGCSGSACVYSTENCAATSNSCDGVRFHTALGTCGGGGDYCEYSTDSCSGNFCSGGNVWTRSGCTGAGCSSSMTDDCSGAGCTNGVCDAQCGNGVREGAEECDSGSNNGVVCSASPGQTCNYCNSGSCTVASYTEPETYSWSLGGYEPCGGPVSCGTYYNPPCGPGEVWNHQTQSRYVYCRDSSGNEVSYGLCSGPAPDAQTQVCNVACLGGPICP